MVTTVNNTTMIITGFPSSQIVSLFTPATILDRYTRAPVSQENRFYLVLVNNEALQLGM
jgi:hypothetical protein